MNDFLKVRDVVSLTKGFFSHIPYEYPENITPSLLDVQFYSNYGLRTIAPVVMNFLTDKGILENDSLDEIGKIIFEMYHYKWDKQLAIYSIQYNPIYNYKDEYHETHSLESNDIKGKEWDESNNGTRTDNLAETISKGVSQLTKRTDNLSQLKTDNLNEEHSGTLTENSTRTDNLQKKETRNLNQSNDENVNDNVYGFNSTNAVGDTNGTSHSTITNTGTTQFDNTGTQQNNVSTIDGRNIANTGTSKFDNTGTQEVNVTHSGEDTTTHTGTQQNVLQKEGKNNEKDDYNESGSREYEHIGNIGNHPTQQLINDEIELWRWNFIQEMLDDVKNFLTIPMYLC